MTSEMLFSLGRLFLGAFCVACIMVSLFRLRTRFELTVLYVVLGGFQLLQAILAGTLFVEIFPDVLVNPGSVILFTATLFSILLVYIRKDADEARSLIVGVAVTNVLLSSLLLIVGWYMNHPSSVIANDVSRELFDVDVKMLMVGTGALVIDALLIIMIYETVSRRLQSPLFVRIFLAMAIVVTVDSIMFSFGGFSSSPQIIQIFISGWIGKLLMSVMYSFILAFYLTTFEHVSFDSISSSGSTHGVFATLTYRERYHVLREELMLDRLTGLYNRGFFEETLTQELQRASHSHHNVSLMLLDLDHFKTINDNFGHQEGDRVLKFFGDSLRFSLRTADLPCRYGGEEFAIILPDTASSSAHDIADRIRVDLAKRLKENDPRSGDYAVTMTIGLAEFPAEAGDEYALIKLADKRLYEGKEAGRDRVVSSVRTTVPRE